MLGLLHYNTSNAPWGPQRRAICVREKKGKGWKRNREWLEELLEHLKAKHHCPGLSQVLQAGFCPDPPARLQHGTGGRLPQPHHRLPVRRHPHSQLPLLHLQLLQQALGGKWQSSSAALPRRALVSTEHRARLPGASNKLVSLGWNLNNLRSPGGIPGGRNLPALLIYQPLVLFLHPELDGSLVPDSKGPPVADSAATPGFHVRHGKSPCWRVRGGLSAPGGIPCWRRARGWIPSPEKEGRISRDNISSHHRNHHSQFSCTIGWEEVEKVTPVRVKPPHMLSFYRKKCNIIIKVLVHWTWNTAPCKDLGWVSSWWGQSGVFIFCTGRSLQPFFKFCQVHIRISENLEKYYHWLFSAPNQSMQ